MSAPRRSSLDLLCAMTTTDMAFLNAVYDRALKDEPRHPKDIAAMFTDCSTQRASAAMHRLARLGAARWDAPGPRLRPTEVGVQAMRHHFRRWREVFSEDDDLRAVALTAQNDGSRNVA